MVAEGFMLRNERVAVEAVGPPITFVNVFRYPAYLPDDPLTNALAQFGKVKSVAFATYNRQNKLNGVRVVRMEMSKPVPNFTTVAGHRVMFEYRGMRRVCARCSETRAVPTRAATFALGSGTESSSPDSSRDSWVVVSSGPEDQASLPKGEETTDNEGHGAPVVNDVTFPPLHDGNTRPPSFDDIPIKSCGRYIPPVDKAHDAPAALPGPSRQSPTTSKAEVAPAPGKTQPPGLEQRHRSHSRQRSADGKEDRTAGRAENAETALRRSGPPGGSSDSDAPARNQPKRPRKGSVGDGAPQPSDEVA
ncbi:hypothetical protein HPB52_023200 [Rhipicephalus sanguineus]|uniref:Uncharacterized protein n=1 Tax=Rhipicephalus sanguineus TaxID=34632 RepID=A0A9D4QCD5_RHISA|nr:hypothetical protein HPB52_023200 [Rhipicephalus sanguineus]